MSFYFGDKKQNKIYIDNKAYKLVTYPLFFRFVTSDNFVIKDSEGAYIIPKENYNDN